jgi:hypothetical protein
MLGHGSVLDPLAAALRIRQLRQAVVEHAQLNRAEPSAMAAILNEQRHSPLNLRGHIVLAAQGLDFLFREERVQLGPRVLASELTA